MPVSMLLTLIFLALVPPSRSFAQDTGAKELYARYCASCHGLSGKGDGAVSRDLKVKVPDLTLLRRNNGGRYPLSRVMSAIDGSRHLRAHGAREMPVWGEVFRQEHESAPYTELTVLLKTKMLAEYVGTLQR